MLLDLLQTLKTNGVKLWLDGDALRFQAPSGVMSQQIKDQMRRLKPEIIEFLREAADSIVEGGDAIPIVDRSKPMPLSSAQQRLWFIDRFEGANAVYNMSCALRLRGILNVEALARCFETICKRHEVLRTNFFAVNGQPQLSIDAKPRFELIRESAEFERCQALASEFASLPFDLEKDCLIRAKLMALDTGDHLLVVSMHHIVSDGWSLGVLVRELTSLYEAFALHKPVPLPDLPLQFADFAAWEQNRGKSHYSRQRKYWSQRLAGAAGSLELPYDHPRPAAQSHRGAKLDFAIQPDSMARLKDLAQHHGTTLFTTLRTALAVLLSRLSGTTDICIGSPIAGRNHAQLEPLIGFFVNTLVFRSQWEDDATFADLLARAKQSDPTDLNHGDLPFDQVLEACQVPRNQAHSPLFQVMFALQNNDLPTLSLGGLEISPEPLDHNTAKFDLSLHIDESGAGQLEFNADVFESETAHALIDYYLYLVDHLQDEVPVRQLPLMDKEKHAKVRDSWNRSETKYPRDSHLWELFQARAEADPQMPAYEWQTEDGEWRQLDYRELQTRVNAMATGLKQDGVRAGCVVGIYAKPSVDMIAAVLAIVKLGGTYLPLDPAYPQDRLKWMVVESGAPVVVVDDGLRIEGVEAVSQLTLAALPTGPSTDEESPGAPDFPAYINYTSGSTGRPKGIVVPHRAVVRLVCNTNYVDIQPGDRMARFSNISFDAATFEIWGALLNGATLVEAPPQTLLRPQSFADWIENGRVGFMFLTAAVFNQTVAEIPQAFAGMKALYVGGEALDPASVRACLASEPPAILGNGYGPTENTTFSVCGAIGSVPEGASSVPLGQTIANSTAHVVDRHSALCPLGVVGELVVGGDGLAQGYLARPALTAERFIPNPFSEKPGERLYKTGDLARRTNDGVLWFIGRRDHQIKLRGFRIELGEIEAHLNELDDVNQAVVLVEGHGNDRRLVAFAQQVGDLDRAEAAETALESLREHLPGYMVPTQLVLLTRMPLTPNGKVDRRALQTMAGKVETGTKPSHLPPRTPVEAEVAACFKALLLVPEVGAHDDFFALGGHSLMATRLVAALEQRLGAAIPLKKLFQRPTVAEIAQEIERVKDETTRRDLPRLKPVKRDKFPALSHAQQRLWILDRLEPRNPAYNIVAAVYVRGNLNFEALQTAFNALIARHESLRTRFRIDENGQPYQDILEELIVPIERIDLPQRQALEARANEVALQPFHLEEGPLVRVTLLLQKGQDPVLVLNMHHIISDGWSMSVFLDELGENYLACEAGTAIPERETRLQYADFSAWQRQWLAKGELTRQLDYWREQLHGAPHLLELPLDRVRPPVQGNRGATLPVVLDDETTQALNALAEREEATVYMVLQALFASLLGRYARSRDVVIGSPVANRDMPGLEPIIGFFVNTIALRFDLEGEPNLLDVVARAKDTVLDALANQDAPFDQVIETIQPPRDLSYAPIFQVMFAFQNLPKPKDLNAATSLEPIPLKNVASKFDLTLFLGADGLQLRGALEYNADLFDPVTIERLWHHFRQLTAKAIANPRLPIFDIELSSAEEIDAHLNVWNDTATTRDLDLCFHQRFETHAKQSPRAVAVTDRRGSMTFQALNRKANQLAHYLRKRGVGPDVPVGVLMTRRREMIVGLFAILKAGGYYVPMDPSYPPGRLSVILEGVSLVLTEDELVEKLADSDCEPLPMTSWAKLTSAESKANPTLSNRPDHLAYAIYTSGSTGKPKGVAITHRNLVYYLAWCCDTLDIESGNGAVVQGSISFDATVSALWPPLMVGRPIHLIEDGNELEGLVEELTKKHDYSLLKMTPAHLDALSRLDTDAKWHLPTTVVGGESLIGDRLEFWKRVSPDTLLYNEYGPTEATVGCTIYPMRLGEIGLGPVPIGHPLPDAVLYVLEPSGCLAPVGIPGELFIGGAGLARGYLGRPSLTASRFVPNPFAKSPGLRLYRTGDLVKRRRDGALIFIGRTDHQVKVRGFRIELAEVETALAGLDGVHESAVLFDGQRLIGFFTVEEGHKAPESEALLTELKHHLPSYMLPSALVHLAHFPLTRNGKVDRAALGAMKVDLSSDEVTYEAPRYPIETRLTELFAELLELPRVGIHDHFFQLGGHSLLATLLVSRIRQALQVELPLKLVFANPVVSDLAQAISKLGPDLSVGGKITPRDPNLPVPMSFSQERLWFLDRLEPGQTAYSMPATLEIHGNVDLPRLRLAALALCKRHESLRTTFAETSKGGVQIIHDQLEPEWRVVYERDLDPRDRHNVAAREMTRAFDLEMGPLLRFLLVIRGETHLTMFVNMHHIISDGWSMSILVRELAAFYAEAEPNLAPLKIGYGDYASWQRTWLQGETLTRYRNFWKTYLHGVPTHLDLPFDRPRPPLQTFCGALESFSADDHHIAELSKLTASLDATLFMGLHAIYALLLSRYARQDDLCIGTPVANRTRPEQEPLIGLFVNTLAMRTQLDGDPSFRDLVVRQRDSDLEAFAHGDVPFEQVVGWLRPERDQSYSPLFQVMFNMQTERGADFTVADLDIKLAPPDLVTSKFDLTLSFDATGTQGLFEYNTDLFDTQTVRDLIDRFKYLLGQAVENPQRALSTFTLTPPSLLDSMVRLSMGPIPKFATDVPVHALVERAVETNRDAVALLVPCQHPSEAAEYGLRMVDDTWVVTYGQLNRLANMLAHDLLSQGIGPEAVVGICLNPSVELFVAVLGVLKAGAAYVPLDPETPAERLQMVLEDSGMTMLLTSDMVDSASPTGVPCGLVPEVLAGGGAIENPSIPQSGAAKAYIIYTSGSTGRPKGVVIDRRNLAAHAQAVAETFGLCSQDRVLQFAAFNFDVFAEEVFPTWHRGATLVVRPPDAGASLAVFDKFLRRSRISVANLPAAFWHEWVDEVARAGQLDQPTLRLVVTGSDKVHSDRAGLWHRLTKIPLLNGYGMTETTISSTFYRAHQPFGKRGVLPIGRPLAGNRALVVDERLRPLPSGVPGELVIGGWGPGRGYHGQPGLTALSFVPDPFSQEEGARIYRTGDLVRCHRGGDLWFMGRLDAQVKLRGFRIELGEIENVLRKHQGVGEAVVVLKHDHGKQYGLVAYLQPSEPGVTLDIQDLQDHLATHLPSHMMPRQMIVQAQLPLMPNGKIDRIDLEQLPLKPLQPKKAVPPETETERLLAGIWEDVLGMEITDVHANFFDIGGHSLLATRMIAAVRHDMGLELPLRSPFNFPTLSQMAGEIDRLRRGSNCPKAVKIPTVDRKGSLPLSFAQERLWFLEKLEGTNTAFNMPTSLKLKGNLDVVALEAAIRRAIDRQESLRLAVSEKDGVPHLVPAAFEFNLTIEDLSGLPEAAQLARAGKTSEAHGLMLFDTARGPLLAAHLLKLGRDDHILLVNLHHIVSDGWSMSVLVHEICDGYRALTMGTASTLPSLPIQYADYAHWQRHWLEGEILDGQMAWWMSQLSGTLPVLDLPTDRPRYAGQGHESGRVHLSLDPALSEAIRQLARGQGATLFMTLLAVYKVLLGRITRNDDLIVGFPIAGRTRTEFEALIGFFINTLVIRTDLSDGDAPATFQTILERVREGTLGVFEHQDTPFPKLVEALQPERDLSRNPIFQVFFNMVNTPEADLDLPGLEISGFNQPDIESKFDLTLYASEREDRIALTFHYNAALFDQARMQRMANQYRSLLEQVVAEPGRPIAQLSLLTETCKALLPDLTQPLPENWPGSVPALFAEMARRFPEKTAVVDAEGELDYATLDQLSNRLAQRLLAGGLAKGDRVALFAHRRLGLPLAVLAILKAGGAFVILDPGYPAGRLVDFLDVAAPRAWIAQVGAGAVPEAVAKWLDGHKVDIRVTLPAGVEACLAELQDEPETAPQVTLSPTDSACVTFTSGSTGKPKGVLGRHGSLSHFLPHIAELFHLGPDCRFGALSGLAHDPLQRDIFTPLNLGGTLCIPDADVIAPGLLAEWMAANRITDINLTPAMGSVLTEARDAGPLPELKNAYYVGEALTRKDLARLRSLAPNCQVVNFYGTTETQRAIGYYAAKAEDFEVAPPGAARQVLPLGRGFPGVQLLVHNPAGELAAIGEIGEVSIRSRFLAAGYLGDDALTERRFRPSPNGSDDPEDRCYLTGDLGYYRADGNVIFAGRADAQIKIRGFRVEPAEIEAALVRHPDIREAVVLGTDSEPKALVAYLVPEPEADRAALNMASLRPFLSRSLPSFMVPGYVMVIDKIPLTPNRKIDRRALPKPNLEVVGSSDIGRLPQTPAEEIVAEVWQQVLGLKRIGVHQNFFELGGHSLLATQVLARLRERAGVSLALRQLFESPTVAELAEHMDRTRRGEAETLEPIPIQPRGKPFPLSLTQQRLWFLSQLDGPQAAYNLSVALDIEGPFDAGAMAEALDDLVARHETLRTTFGMGDGEGVQIVAPPEPVALVTMKLNDDTSLEALANEEASLPFDLATGPLFRCKLFRLSPRRHALFLSVHHIVSDGWSLGVLARDLVALYAAHQQGISANLPQLRTQFADYAVWQRDWLHGARSVSQLAFWSKYLAGAPALLTLPTDRPRPAVQTFNGSLVRFQLGLETTRKLKRLVLERGATLFMGLSAFFGLLMGRLSGQTDVVFGTPIAGRTRRELEDLNGFFVNTLALRLPLEDLTSVAGLIDRARETTLAAYANQDVPFEQVVDHLQPARNLSFSPIFQVMLVLQNAPVRAMETGDLTFTPIPRNNGASQFDLRLEFADTDEGLVASCQYNTDLFDRESIERMWQGFETLLCGGLSDAEANPLTLPMMRNRDRALILNTWNDTAKVWPDRQPIHRSIEARAETDPDRIALIYERQSLTYADYNRAANRLAHRLRAMGVGPDVPVGVCMTRSMVMCVALLGIVKAGGYYIPLDPTHPGERLAMAIEDSGMDLVVCQSRWRVVVDGLVGRIVDLETDPDLADALDTNPEGETAKDQPAYAIYTSGSTGRPKGVVNTHGGLHNRIHWMQARYELTPEDVVLQKTPFTFDVSVWEFFWAHLAGATLAIARPEGHKDPCYLVDEIRARNVTTVHFVPSMLQAFLEHPEVDRLTGLRRVFCSGEALNGPLAADFYGKHPTAEIVNLYGPTEAAVDVSYFDCPRGTAFSGILPIGKPVPNANLFTLDQEGLLCPVGVPGELLIGGVQLARGYLNRPALTAESFVPNPFATEENAGSRLYRTGDLARCLNHGDLAFLGRIDHQVKIRGVRIELGEIEAVLAKHPLILQNAVITHEDKVAGLQLVAFVSLKEGVADEDGGLADFERRLKNDLAAKLPEAYLPARVILTEVMPLLSNGKINRKALAVPDVRPDSASAFVAPRNRTERQIAAVWTEILQREKASIDDTFFELGGHSLLMIKAHLKMKVMFGETLTLVELFQFPTIRKLADHVRRKQGLGSGQATSTRGDRVATRTDDQLVATRRSAASRRRNIRARKPS